jgi:O-antigen biosynthesis protein
MSAPRTQSELRPDPPTDSPDTRWLEAEVRLLDQRISQIESSRFFRFMRWAGGILDTQKKKVGQVVLHSPFHPLYLRLWRPKKAAVAGGYTDWIAAQESLLPSRSLHQSEAARWRFQPTISVLIPVFRPKREWLERAVGSVKAQSYPKWQLCLGDDASEEPWVREYLEAEAAVDSRIRVVFRESNGGISASLNAAGQLATGEYVTFLDHDDELDPFALHYIVEACQRDEVDVLYSDEDYLDPSGARSGPTFKPDWSPELLHACMYFGHLLVAARRLIDEVGWFRSLCDGAQDYDLALRLVERARNIVHIRRVLYHWRQHLQSTSMNPKAKPYAHEAGRRALTDAMARLQIPATIEDGPLLFTYYIQRSGSRQRVSLVVCSRDSRRLSVFLAAQKRTRYPSVELVVVEHISPADERLSRLLDSTQCVRVPYTGPFNFSRMNNLGAQAAGSELLVFINDDVTPIRPEWLDVIAAHLERPKVGVVGARLLYPLGTLQHAGLVFGMQDGAGHPGRGVFYSELMYYLQLPRDVSAVAGACLGIRQGLFQELGGFDLSFPVNYGDLDLCFRAGERGYRVLVDPRVELTHVECGTRRGGTTFAERRHLQERWSHVLAKGDPYYPEAFDRTTEEVRLAIPYGG